MYDALGGSAAPVRLAADRHSRCLQDRWSATPSPSRDVHSCRARPVLCLPIAEPVPASAALLRPGHAVGTGRSVGFSPSGGRGECRFVFQVSAA